jgi:hypothetical protein
MVTPGAVGGKWSVARWVAWAAASWRWDRTSLYRRIDPKSDRDVMKKYVESRSLKSYIEPRREGSEDIEVSCAIQMK